MASTTFKEHWRELRAGKPGRRFQDHYRHEKEESRTGGRGGRLWRLGLGILLVGVGLVLLLIPGPGLPFVFLGGGLLAAESLVVARIMDWLELRVRGVLRWAKVRWRRLPGWGKIAVSLMAAAFSAASMWVFFHWMKN